jgi:AraC-like DNA-binding protein
LKGLPFNETNGFSCQNNEARADFFYKLAEAIVQDQMPVFKQLHNIPSVKYSTKKDLYKRIQKSIEFIDGSFENDLNINNIATHSFMSEYHFYRLFKQVQGISPMQLLKLLCTLALQTFIALAKCLKNIFKCPQVVC